MNDAEPFVHGEEGTHVACAVKANSDGPTTCCVCDPHEGCEL